MRAQFALIAMLPFLLLAAPVSPGVAEEATDTREPAPRTDAEKAFVLEQMRLFLASITEIENALGSGDMDQVAREAAARGRKANVTLARPPSLATKESEAWRMMMGSARTGFDQIAEQAAARAPAAQINKTLADTMLNCVACHQAYRITVDAR
jgi:hypothetical protein